MSKLKLLLYCYKQPHKLFNTDKGFVLSDFELGDFYKDKPLLNGKIVAECDFEVKYFSYRLFECLTHNYLDLLKKSCLNDKEMYDYLNGNDGYAIHIKNLHIFDEPRELNYYVNNGKKLERTPKNILSVSDIYKEKIIVSSKEMNTLKIEDCYVISCSPQELCRILNKEQNILVKKRVLKEML